MSAPPGRPKERSLPLGGKREAQGSPVDAPPGRPKERSALQAAASRDATPPRPVHTHAGGYGAADLGPLGGKREAQGSPVGAPPGRLRLVAIGASAGGVAALGEILPGLAPGFCLPIVIVVHVPPSRQSLLADLFARKCRLPVQEAFDKAPVEPGHVYFSPPDYHLMIETGFTFALSVDAPVNYSRPSIDVLLESAAASIGEGVLAIILTGTNSDGAHGMKAVRDAGGIGWVQLPDSAQASMMPRSAIEMGGADAILTLPGIALGLSRLGGRQ